MNKEIEELLNSIDEIIKEVPNESIAIYGIQVNEYRKIRNYIEQLENNRDKAIEYLEKSKLNQLDTYCKYLYIDFDAEKIENIDELIDILKGDSDYE